jgi:hypothetical protein
MTTLRTRLSEGDPAAGAELSSRDVQEMRRLIVAAAERPEATALGLLQPLAVAALIVLMIGAGVIGGRRVSEREHRFVPAAVEVPARESERRQLQFSTPGGTRIIWVFDSEFQLKDTTP